jgi:hypothetical protein
MMELFPTSEFAAVPLNNLADLYAAKKKFRLAAETFALSVAWTEKYHGAEHPSMVVILINLGCAHLLSKNTHEAEAVFRRTLSIVEKSQGVDHVDCVGPLLGLARAAAVLERELEAKDLLNRARRLIESDVSTSGGLMEAWTLASSEVSQTKRRK